MQCDAVLWCRIFKRSSLITLWSSWKDLLLTASSSDRLLSSTCWCSSIWAQHRSTTSTASWLQSLEIPFIVSSGFTTNVSLAISSLLTGESSIPPSNTAIVVPKFWSLLESGEQTLCVLLVLRNPPSLFGLAISLTVLVSPSKKLPFDFISIGVCGVWSGSSSRLFWLLLLIRLDLISSTSPEIVWPVVFLPPFLVDSFPSYESTPLSLFTSLKVPHFEGTEIVWMIFNPFLPSLSFLGTSLLATPVCVGVHGARIVGRLFLNTIPHSFPTSSSSHVHLFEAFEPWTSSVWLLSGRSEPLLPVVPWETKPRDSGLWSPSVAWLKVCFELWPLAFPIVSPIRLAFDSPFKFGEHRPGLLVCPTTIGFRLGCLSFESRWLVSWGVIRSFGLAELPILSNSLLAVPAKFMLCWRGFTGIDGFARISRQSAFAWTKLFPNFDRILLTRFSHFPDSWRRSVVAPDKPVFMVLLWWSLDFISVGVWRTSPAEGC